MTLPLPSEKTVETLLQTFDPQTIADESMRQVIVTLLNHTEQLRSEITALKAENQRLRSGEPSRSLGNKGNQTSNPIAAKKSNQPTIPQKPKEKLNAPTAKAIKTPTSR